MNIRAVGRVVLWCVVAVLGLAVLMQLVWRADKSDPVLIRSYDVPMEIASEVRQTLANVLSRGNDQAPLGRVSLLPNGQLVVTAPASVQTGLQRLLDNISKTKPAPTPTIAFDLWTVAVAPGSAATRTDALTEVEPALEAIRKTKGPVQFQLREKLSTITRSGQDPARVTGTGTTVQISASLRRDEQDQTLVAASVQAGVFGSVRQALRLDATAELRPGELLVIGQSDMADSRGGHDGPTTEIYYILRARL